MIDGTEAGAKAGKAWLSNEDYAKSQGRTWLSAEDYSAKLKVAQGDAVVAGAKGASAADIASTLQSTHGLSAATAAKVVAAAKAVQGR
jgi:hypothetical protein